MCSWLGNDHAVDHQLGHRLADPGRVARVLRREDVLQRVDRRDLVGSRVGLARFRDADTDVQPAVAIEDVVAALADQDVVAGAADEDVTVREDLLRRSVRVLEVAELGRVGAERASRSP